MADEALTPAELETLLSAKLPAPNSPPAARPTAPSLPTPASPRLDDAVKHALAARHERCARQFAADLAAVVRRAAQAKLTAVDATTYRQLIARLDSPTCFQVLSAAPLAGPWLLEISPAILFPIIDCMLGGGRAAEASARRPLTDIDQRLAARVTSAFLGRLREAWKDRVDIEPAVERVECYPQRAAAMKADEALVWIRFELAVGHARGLLNLAIPLAVVEEIEPKPIGRPGTGRETPPPPQSPPTVELAARLAQSKIASPDAAALGVGDVIATGERVDAPIAVVQDGELKFHARVGVVAGRKAIEIEKVAPPPGDANVQAE